MSYGYIFFDADNTLFDYDAAEARALSLTLTKIGLPVKRDMVELYRGINERTWREFEDGKMTLQRLRSERFRRLFDHLDLEKDAEEIGAFYLDRLGEGAFLVDRALEVLKTAASVCECCIVTNGIPEVQRSRFSRSPLMRYLKGLIISGEVGSQKPQEGIFQAAMELSGNPEKKDVLMVGDSLTSDILGGIRFGIDTCYFNPGGKKADNGIVPTFEIATLPELLPILGVEGAPVQ